MFCTNCGKKVPDESKFCPACGTFLYKEEEQITVKEQAPTVKPSPKPEPKPKSEITEKQQAATILTAKQEAPKIETGSYQQAAEAAPSSADTIEDVIGKNAAYYLSEFRKVDEGQKNKFNLAAFFLGLFFCFYRKCDDLFKKYFLIPVAILIAALIVTSIAFHSFSLPIIALGGILSTVGSVWAFVNYIRFGKNFNKEYCVHCKAVLATGNKKKYGTSIGSAIIVLAAVVVLSLLPSAISFLSIFGDSIGSDNFGGLNDISGSSTMLLDGEYALVEDTASGEYVYLNFSWNGDGTLQICSSDDPAEVIDVTYRILPAKDIIEGVDSYTILINSDYLGEETEFFEFCSWMDDGTYYVRLSELLAEGEMLSGMMVPLTEEFGFTTDEKNYSAGNNWPDNYSGYNLYNYQNTYISDNGYELELIVLPSDTEFHANLNWSYSESEGGIVYPGVPSQLDRGSTIVLNLNEDGSIHVVLNDIISETLTANTKNSAAGNEESSLASTPNQSILRAEQERLYSAMNQQTKGLYWYEDNFTGPFLDESDEIYIEVIAYCDDHGSESYYLNYWAGEIQLECIPADYNLCEPGTLFFSLDDYFSDYKGVVTINYDECTGEYLLWSEIDNCQDTYGNYSSLQKIS